MKKKNPTLLSERIRILRQEQGLLQTDLAERLNTTSSNVSNYESGKTKPPIDKIREMSSIFGVPIDYLTGESDSRAFKPEKKHIDVNSYLSELIQAIDNPEISITYNKLPMPQESKDILQINLETTLHIVERQLQTFFNDLINKR